MSDEEKAKVAAALRNLERIRRELIEVADLFGEVIWENDLNERVDSMIDKAIDQVRDAGNLARQRWLLS